MSAASMSENSDNIYNLSSARSQTTPVIYWKLVPLPLQCVRTARTMRSFP